MPMLPNKLFDFFDKKNTGEVIRIKTDLIQASLYQPRIHFDQKALEELAASIEANGLIQPITVRVVEDHYEIIAGERRFRACQLLNREEVECYVLSPSENEAAEMALVENIQRENLSAIEEAKSYVAIMRQSGLTQQKVAKKVGKSQSSIANKIRLLNLPEEIQMGVVEQTISERHARALLTVKKEKQIDVYKEIVDKKYNVRETESFIQRLSDTDKKDVKKKPLTKGFTRNIKIGINSVNECVAMIKKMGIEVKLETKETDEDLIMSIRFPKG